jgi:prepilin-type N-terminal cleavage/methylation domain-containing protein
MSRLRAFRARSERGDTLVEVLITISVVGIAFTGLLAGLATAINLSGVHRGQANADVVLVSAADSVKNQTYIACPIVNLVSYNPTQGVNLPSGWSASDVAVTSVKGWNGSAFVSCPVVDGKLQLVTITATTPDSRSSESIDVVKRNSS